MQSIHWNSPAGEWQVLRKGEGTRKNEKDTRVELVAGPYFVIEEIRGFSSQALGGKGSLQALIVTEGYGRFENGEFVMPGDAWVLPASMPQMVLHADAGQPFTGLLCTLPR